MNTNVVVLIGRLTKDVEVRKTSSGLSVATFTVAVERPKAKDQEESKTDFINCVAWRGSADYLGNYGSKGSTVSVEGRIQTRNYENSNGDKVYVTEVLANSVSIEFKKSTNGSDYPYGGQSVKKKDISEMIVEDAEEESYDLPF